MCKQKQLSLLQYFPNPKSSNNSNAEPDQTSSAATISEASLTTTTTTGAIQTDGGLASDIALTSSSPLVQPSNIKFPETVSSGIKQSFNPAWFQKYPWMEYSVTKNAIFCFPCSFFGAASIGTCRPEKLFTTKGFSDWKHATGSTGVLFKHHNSSSHQQATVAWKQFQQTSLTGFVTEQLGSNRERMLYDDIVRVRLEKGPRNAINTSHSIQNTIINRMATIVRNKICDCIQQAGYFSILVDETKNISKNEQMSISIRYLDQDSHSIKECFLTFVIASNLTAEYLSKYILDTLSLYNLDAKLLVSQGYDGASVMSGCVSEVQKRIRDVAPQAIYVHCHAHCLNLVLVDCVKSNSHCSDFFSLQSLYNFMSTSKSHVVFMEKQKELYPDKQPTQLQSLSETRWACRYLSLEAIVSTFDAVLATLESIGEGSDKQKAVEAVGLFHLVTSFKFLSCLIIF
uniref:TTF-type domain-containing protein n=1 Tax=Amphimedon queenslandica TaxID=400682 RepID=A0A1X7VK12_AMPQE